MIASKTFSVLALANLATAHFGLNFPEWRADTLSEENEEKYSQWTYPCRFNEVPMLCLLVNFVQALELTMESAT